MAYAASPRTGIDLASIERAFAPAPIRFDPFGLVTGYKAYSIYSALAAQSDAELAAMQINRADLPAIAMDAARKTVSA